MKDVPGNCCIPFGLFGAKAPDHVISSIEIISNKFIITGDENGQILIWKINSLVDVCINWFLHGHSGAITNICKINTNDIDERYFASFSSTREVALWNCIDGRCVRFERNVALDHLYVLSYKPSSRASNVLFCCGKYPGIQMLDSLSLRPTLQLRSQGYPNWIRSLCVFEHQQQGVHVVLGLSVAGAAILWTIESLDGSAPAPSSSTNYQNPVFLYETESRLLQSIKWPIAISMCPVKPRFVLVISAAAAQIYDAASWTLICHEPAPTNPTPSCFVAGRFLDAKTILVQSKTGSVYLYMVPFSMESPPIGRDDLPLRMASDGRAGGPCEMAGSGNNEVIGGPSRCHACVVDGNELTVAFGYQTGSISVIRSHLIGSDEGINHTDDIVSTSLSFSLASQWCDRRFISIIDPISHRGVVTSCHFARINNCVIFGMENGDIIVTDLLQIVCASLFPKQASAPEYSVILQGHRSSVLALLYEQTAVPEDKSHSYKWLWSGAADYCVRLWDLEAGNCVNVFNCHWGPVRCIVKGPMLGLTRAKHEGHIRAHKNKDIDELEVLKPINGDSWFGPHLYVSIDADNGIAFLSLDSRRVVVRMQFVSDIVSISWRREQIIAMIECADGSVTVWELGSSEMDRCVSGQIARDMLDCGTDKIDLSNPVDTHWSDASTVTDRPKRSPADSTGVTCGVITLHRLPAGPTVSGKHHHMIVFDTEALLVDLHRASTSDNYCSFVEAQLLLTLVNQRGTDECLDKTLESSLGLVPVNGGTVANGLFNSRLKTVSFELLKRHQQRVPSPSMSGQHLLVGVAVCQTLTSLPGQHAWPRLIDHLATATKSAVVAASTIDSRTTTMKQVYCLLATSLVTQSLPQIIQQATPGTPEEMSHIQLVLQQFLHRYQHRCLELREAARTLFQAAMDSLTGARRAQIVRSWVADSRLLELSDDDDEKARDLHRAACRAISSPMETGALAADWRSSWTLAELYEPREVAHMQLVTIAFLAAVGARYGCHDNVIGGGDNNDDQQTIAGFGIEDYRLARITCRHLMRLLAGLNSNVFGGGSRNSNVGGAPVNSSGPVWPEMRRLAISFLGQGFPVWEPYLDVSALFSKLMEVVAGSEKILGGWTTGQLLTDEMDAVRSAKGALLAIALARPKVFATVLSIDVLRMQTQSSSSSSAATQNVMLVNGSLPMKTPAPTSTATGSSNASSSPASSLASPSQPPLLAARHEVIEIVKVLCERKTREMHEVFPEIMDVLLACLNKLELRQFDLQQLFPPILLFRIASSHTASGKVCVGTRSGQLVFYDVKLGKYNTSPGHKNAVTSVTFSPDGKQVASYSMPDNSVCIWQLFSSGLFGMGSSHQVKLASTLNVPPVAVSQTVSEEDSGLLLWLEWYENRSIHLVTNAGLVNKIKL